MKVKSFKVVCVIIPILIIVLTFGFLPKCSEHSTSVGNEKINLLSEEISENVDIVKDGVSNYVILFSQSDSMTNDTDFANELSNTIRKTLGPNVRYRVDSAQAEGTYEILLGLTNRQFSRDLAEQIAPLALEGEYVWIIAERDGQIAYLANSAAAFERGKRDLLAYLTDASFSVPKNLNQIGHLTKEQIAEEEEIKRLEHIEELKQLNSSSFNEDMFGKSEYKPMIGQDGYYSENPFSAPWVYPTKGEHPRYLLTKDNIERIREMLNDPYYKSLSVNFWKLADSKEKEHCFGVFPEVEGDKFGIYRYDSKILAMIDAKALAYLITGDETYAMEAIISIKNAILTLNYTKDLHGDTYHGASHLMITLAAVYDWCYDVLTETDKWQLIYATATVLADQLEEGMKYPPKGMNGVSGHGTGPQFLRDWMTVATVFFDEAPDWWDFVAGRYFKEYLPVTNTMYENGWVSQGTAIYGQLKIYNNIWAAYLIKTATGESFVNEDIRLGMYYQMSVVMPNGRYFETGDGSRNNNGSKVGFSEFFIAAALFDDPVCYAHAREASEGHTVFFFEELGYDTILTMTPAFQLCFSSAVEYNGEGMRENVDTIQYFGSPAGQMTVRDKWDGEDAIAVMMKIGNMTMANHDLLDHGTFQIYYKGLLAGTSGSYLGYGMPSHYYYHQATVAHNGLLVFNPAMADAKPLYDMNAANPANRIKNAKRYYYSGGQEARSEAGTIENWLSGKYNMAETTGVSYEYNRDGTAKYGYIAGDLTNAYNADTVDYLGRRMLTVFTENPSFPVLFLTYDQITSVKESFTKSWLLHVIKEPVVDTENMSVTVVNGDGKMYVHSVFGADQILAIGGSGKAYWINGYYDEGGNYVEGKNCTDEYTSNDNAHNIWGRIELQAVGSKKTDMLTLMAVTDAVNEEKFTFEKFESDSVYGVNTERIIAAFTKSTEYAYKEFSFVTEGNGLYDYYISGVEAGTWQVKVDGVSVAYSLADPAEGLIRFTAPTGTVTLLPGNDVIGANGGKIQYSTGGGVLPLDAPYNYRNENDTLLPSDIVRGEDKFLGWYTTPTFEEGTKITAIPAGTTGTVKVYAKWFMTFVNEDYTTTKINALAAWETVNGIDYNGSGKKDSSFITKTDKNGVNYLEWCEGSMDSLITQRSETKNIAAMTTEDGCISYTFKMSRNEGTPVMASHIRLIAKKDVSGGAVSGADSIFLTITQDGNILAADNSFIDSLYNDVITEIRIVIDFNTGDIRYYDKNLAVIKTVKLPIPSNLKANTAQDFKKCLDEYVWYWYGCTSNAISDASMRIYEIRVQEGDEFTGKEIVRTEGIKYNTGGARLPQDAPLDFAETGATFLPTDMEMNGCVFDGWYTSPDFAEETRTYFAPEGTTGIYEVFAKWRRIFIDADYNKTEIDLDNKQTVIEGITYGGNNHPGVTFKTETDSDGKKYLLWTVGTGDPLICATNTVSNISVMTENSISYTLTLGSHGNVAVPDFEFRVLAKKTVTGGDSTTNLYLGTLKDGVFYLTNNTSLDNIVASIESGQIITIRLVVDFAAGTLSAYNEKGRVLVSAALDVPSASGASTALEWKQCFRDYLFYTRHVTGAAGDGRAIRYYGIKIEEGNVFKTDSVDAPNTIVYKTNGSKLPADAPDTYETDGSTVLPELTMDGWIFDGWYTDKAFASDTRITSILEGTEGIVTVYAKWRKIFVDTGFDSFDYPNETGTTVITKEGVNIRVFNPGSTLKTLTDDSGNKYIKVTAAASDAIIYVTNDTYNLPSMSENVLSITFDVKKEMDITTLDALIKIGTSGGTYGQLDIAKVDGLTGEIKLANSETVIATVGETATTLRLAVDFESGLAYAFDSAGNVIDSSALTVPTNKVATLAEWKTVARNYLLYIYLMNSWYETTSASSSLGFDNLKVVEGNIFA